MGNNTVKSVIKAIKIFEKIVEEGQSLSLSNLSRKINMNISTVHRLLNTLLEEGYIKQNQNGHYQLGLRAYEISDMIDDKFELKKVIHPFLEEIVAVCNETTNLVVLEDFEVVYIDQVESTNMVRMFAGEGRRGAAYCTGAGKALLANLNKDQLKNYLTGVELQAFTDNTITDIDTLKKELEKIKRQGYALDLEEREKGVRCVAAPVFGKNKELLGAISVSGPCSRISVDYLEEALIPLVKNKAEEVSREFVRRV